MHQWTTNEDARVRDLPFYELQTATGGFHPHRKLGGGGSCTVYQGDLFGLAVAVKHLSRGSMPGATDQHGLEWEETQFKAETDL